MKIAEAQRKAYSKKYSRLGKLVVKNIKNVLSSGVSSDCQVHDLGKNMNTYSVQ